MSIFCSEDGLELQLPGSIFTHHNLYPERFLRNQMTGFFGPLDETEIPGKKILFITHIEELAWILDPVEVEMEDGATLRGKVLVYKGESGAVYLGGDSQSLAKGLDKGGLSGSHFTR